MREPNLTSEVPSAGVDSVAEAVQAEKLPLFVIDLAACGRMSEVRESPVRIPDEGSPGDDSPAGRPHESLPSPMARAAKLHALSAAGQPTRIEAYAHALQDDDPDVRATAVAVLTRKPSDPMVPLLLRALDDQDERVWRTAAGLLARTPRRALRTLWARLQHTRAERREEIIGAMRRHTAGRLLRLVESSSRDAPARRLVVHLATRARTRRAGQAVLRALLDPDPSVRSAAVAALPALRTPGAIGALAGTLSDPESDVRVEAALALGTIADDRAVDALIHALGDREARVRATAMESLARNRSPEVARRLVAALVRPPLREAAGDTLMRLGPSAVEPLKQLVRGRDREASSAAASLLRRIVQKPAFLDRMSSTDSQERLRSVELLGTFGGAWALDAIAGRLGDPDVRVRSRAAELLGTLGERRAVEPLRRVFAFDPVAGVAALAAESLCALDCGPARRGGPAAVRS